ncbi:MAG: tripartite tricarboxylate transporter substrate binding protein [Hyphomicrobiales bacterium]|nr:tripartite tricarboxylate transporter substrate binding protein [Hyphomicrobiales bacterium]
MIRRRNLLIGLLASAGIGSAAAQTYPDRPVTMIVPFPPGGPTDVMARLVAEGMAARLGQNVVVDHRPGGAGGTIGAKLAAAAEPNGYTVLFSPPGPLAVNAAVYKTLDYDPVGSFAPVAMIGSSPQVLVVHPSIPARNVRELIEYMKANPGKVVYGHPGYGTQPHLLGELIHSAYGAEFTRIPYRGTNPAVTDFLAGQVQMMIDTTAVLLPHIESGKMRALAVAGEARSARLPGVPTTVESGFPDLVALYWTGVVVRTGTPGEIIRRLNAAINEAMRPADVQVRLAQLGADPKPGSPEEFGRFVASEREKWTAVVRSAGIKIE